MSAVPKIVVDADEVITRLADLGFPVVEDWQRALQESNLARSTCTRLDPLTFRGTVTWGVTVRSLRVIQIPRGWTPREKHGVSLTISPDKKHAIIVATGTSGTGRAKGHPKTRSPKGPKIMDAIAAPGIQYALGELLGPQPEQEPEPEIWFFLYRHTRTKNDERRIYAEISRPHPDGITKRGRIAGWDERIILPRIDLDGTGMRKRLPETGPTFDVDVARRVV